MSMPLGYNTFYRAQFLAAPTISFTDSSYSSYGLVLGSESSQASQAVLAASFDSERFNRTGLLEAGQFSGSEDGFGGRYSRFMDPSIDYAYRSGNYFGR